jgi:hypothetical protein
MKSRVSTREDWMALSRVVGAALFVLLAVGDVQAATLAESGRTTGTSALESSLDSATSGPGGGPPDASRPTTVTVKPITGERDGATANPTCREVVMCPLSGTARASAPAKDHRQNAVNR